ncbi:MAG TPA: RtcB family protein [Candidatus Cloacimonetes bacterium]|nr:RtcB family protein [Candidatus Cloacimonadota bacterium]HEX37385.1 RtcB family protein [Candidatus Cloacimonadota bacterium]
MKFKGHTIQKISDAIWEIPRNEEMMSPARFYATQKMLPQIFKDNALTQLINVAHLPGIQKYAMAMPDIHYGYGFPIGGVAAFDLEEGIISPGGVGYDINCGVRFCRTNLIFNEVKDQIEDIVKGFYRYVPSGVGSSGAIKKLNQVEENEVMTKGAQWAIEKGFGNADDLKHIENFGCMEKANPDTISNRARQRGLDQVGTLGSGNHFLEIGTIDKIYDDEVAKKLNLRLQQIVVMVHSGSRGFGYQICDDFLHEMVKKFTDLPFHIPDRQLACAPFSSELGQRYYQAMCCAANYAWANRQVLMSLAERALIKSLSISEKELDFKLIYDVCHNIAKLEKHRVNGSERTLCVHRKGATRAFGPNREELSDEYKVIGQPVIIPGDMGTHSYLLIGTEKAMTESFGSCCHGAGRVMSRSAAKRSFSFHEVKNKLQKQGIVAWSVQKNTLVEESPDTYKNVSDVVDAVEIAGLAKKVVRTRPLGVLKG